jgi:hypothetical protein
LDNFRDKFEEFKDFNKKYELCGREEIIIAESFIG